MHALASFQPGWGPITFRVLCDDINNNNKKAVVVVVLEKNTRLLSIGFAVFIISQEVSIG